jgi:hypothetical protein
MRRRLKIIYTILLLIIFQSLQGQTYWCCNCAENTKTEPRLPGVLVATPADTVTWFNKNWLPGDIFLNSGEIVRNINIKYSGLLDELFWLEPKSGKPVKIDKEAIQKFHFQSVRGDTSVNFRKIKIKRELSNDSIEVLGQEIYRGNLSLFVRHTFYVRQREIINTNSGIIQRDSYEEDPLYIICFMNKKTVALKGLTRKNLYAFAPDKKEQIKQFFNQSRHLKVETNDEIKVLMQFLGSVINQ